MLEEYFIQYASPTLASIKPASLFNCLNPDVEGTKQAIVYWNQHMARSGIGLMEMKSTNHSVLIFMYRKSQLDQILRKVEVQDFLSAYGYDPMQYSLDYYLGHLKNRMNAQESFPHEIGVFLGYPLEDVKGFIAHRAQDSKCVGTWKVYGDAEKAQKVFCRFRKCRDVYCRLFHSGKRSLKELTVAC